MKEHADYIPAKKAEKKPVNTATQDQWPPIVSFAKGAWGDKFQHSNAEKLLQAIKSDKKGKVLVDRVRKTKETNEQEYKRAKEALPSIRWSGKFNGLGKAGLVSYSGICCVDLDHVGDDAKLAEVKAVLTKSPHIIAAFQSPSGDGIKTLVDVRGHNAKTHLLGWQKANELVSSLTGLPYDENTKDYSKICFASYDENISWTWDTTPIAVPTEAELAKIEDGEKRKEARRAEKTSSVATSHYGRAVLDTCVERIRNAQKGERNSKIYVNARTIREFVNGGEIEESEGWNEGLEASLDVGDDSARDTQTFENGWNDAEDDSLDRNSNSREAEYEQAALEMAEEATGTKDTTKVTISSNENPFLNLSVTNETKPELERKEEKPLEVQDEEEPLKTSKTPWRDVKPEAVRKAIAGTALEPIVEAMEMVTEPPLPLEMTLLKAIVLAGCALSGQDGTPKHQIEAEHLKGSDLARVKIMTASGQVPNIYGVLVSGSATGKDIGGIMPWLAGKNDWYIGSGGSREGVLDALVAKPNGLFMLNEMGKLFDKFSFQAPIKELLTESFNRGFVEEILSQRTKIKRNAPYCFPNLFGAVQPETIARLARTEDIDSGFLGRLLFSYYERPQGEKRRKPRNGDLGELKHRANESLQRYKSVSGSFTVPENYSDRLVEMFDNARASHESSYMRLASEYLPRIALMLSVPLEAKQEPRKTSIDIFVDDNQYNTFDMAVQETEQEYPLPSEISQESFDKAEIVCQWFFTMAEKTLGAVMDNEKDAIRLRAQKSIYCHIKNWKGKATITTISRNCRRSGDGEERKKHLKELMDAQWVVMTPDRKFYKVTGETKSLPADW